MGAYPMAAKRTSFCNQSDFAIIIKENCSLIRFYTCTIRMACYKITITGLSV